MSFYYRTFLFGVIILGVVSLSCSANTIHVPGQHSISITAGVQIAQDGDTVLIADGVYTDSSNTAIRPYGKAITIISENGFENCVIDCEGTSRGFILSDDETNATVISGLTIANAYTMAHGGGIYLDDAGVTVENCRFTDCTANNGAAIRILGTHSGITIKNCLFEDGTSLLSGGAMFIQDSSGDILVTGCEFYGNEGANAGGALALHGVTNVEFTDCMFSDNLSNLYTGGAAKVDSDSEVSFINCLFTYNFSAGVNSGGALFFDSDSSGQIFNCTFNGNHVFSGTTGGAIACGSSSSVFGLNNIIWGNTPDEIHEPSGTTVFLMTSDVQGGWGEPAHNNIDQDPLFVSDGSGNNFFLSHTATGHSTDSPCIDSGNSAASSVCYPVGDMDDCLDNYSTRNDRVEDSGTADMGYHYPSYVPPTPTPTPNPTVTPTATPDCINHGDADLNGTITAGDAQRAFEVVLGSYSPSNEEECAADCNGDGTVTAGDAQLIFYTVLGTGSCMDPL